MTHNPVAAKERLTAAYTVGTDGVNYESLTAAGSAEMPYHRLHNQQALMRTMLPREIRLVVVGSRTRMRTASAVGKT